MVKSQKRFNEKKKKKKKKIELSKIISEVKMSVCESEAWIYESELVIRTNMRKVRSDLVRWPDA